MAIPAAPPHLSSPNRAATVFTAISTTSSVTVPSTPGIFRGDHGTVASQSIRRDVGRTLRKNKDFFFAYYEGQRDSAGTTQAAIVPTAAERTGDFRAYRSSTDNPHHSSTSSRDNRLASVPAQPDRTQSGATLPASQQWDQCLVSTQLWNQVKDQG